MKIIGEKINGTRKRVAEAISRRDADLIRNLAEKQTSAGSDWLDINAGTHPSREAEDLVWMIETVQEITDVPVCIDSANPHAVAAALQITKMIPMINSISGEESRLNELLPLAAEYNCPVIALAMDDKNIPETCEKRMKIIRRVMDRTRSMGLPDEMVYVDPLTMTMATNTGSAKITLDTIRSVREEFPRSHITMGLSNISFGLPARSYINRTFLTLALNSGLDSAIIDPSDMEMRAAIVSTELLIEQDAHCLNFTRAYRDGLFNECSNNK